MLHYFQSACLLIFLTVGSVVQVFSQNYAGLTWYFGGNQEGITFTRPLLQANQTNTPQALGSGGSAVASDPVTGELLFYTDGNTVYDGMDRPLATTLGGNTAVNQGIALIKNPADSNQYIIFTINSTTGLLEQSIFDISEYSGPPGFPAPAEGNIVGTPTNTDLPTTPRSSGVTVIPNANNDGYWLISNEVGSSSYDVTEIDATGTVTTTTYPGIGGVTDVANLAYNAATNQIAVSPASPTESVEILSFDPATGALTFVSAIPGTNISTGPGNMYDAEWSNNGNYLYLSGNFGGAEDSLAQVDLTQLPPILTFIRTENIAKSYGLQMAPDSAIYHLYETPAGEIRLGRITAPDTVATQVLYEPTPLGTQDYGGTQFPAFLKDSNPNLTVDFSYSGTCQNEATIFYPDVQPTADSVRWDFGDNSGSQQLAPSHTYADANTFDVTLTAFLGGDSATVTKPVTINAFEIQISVQSDTTFCREDFPPPYGQNGTATVEAQVNGSPTSVVWSNGQTGNTLNPDSSGYYYVIATDASGCSTYAGVTVKTYGEDEQRSNVWYFGDNAGIDFNPAFADPSGPVVAIPVGDPDVYNGGNQMMAPEGTAIYCDRNGQPVFYSDGVDVYDSDGNQLTGPNPEDKIGGDQTATQSVMIVPFPDDETLFYIFTTEEVFGTGTYDLKYAIFDLKDETAGTKGALVRTEDGSLTTTLATGVTERLTGTDNWVIVHDYGTNNFLAFPILGDGIGTPVVSNVGEVHDSERESQGYMKLSPAGLLAVALSESDTENYVELFQFVDSTGAVDEVVQLDFNDPPPTNAGVTGQTAPASVSGQVYGVGFSPDGRNMFATIQGAGESHIYWWPVDSTTTTANETDPSYITDSVRYVSGSNTTLGALQAGPDGILYIAQEGLGSLATITNPNLTLDEVPNIGGFPLAGGTSSGQGLPNFIQTIGTPPEEASLQVSNSCFGDSVTVSIINAQQLELYHVNIYHEDDTINAVRGPITLDQDNPDFTFILADTGTYIATVVTEPLCSGFSNFNMPPQTFVIHPLPDFDVVVVSQPSGCGANDGVIAINFNSSGSLSYSVNGPVSIPADSVMGPDSVNVTGLSAGFYTITTYFNTTGCSDTATVTLNDPLPYEADDQQINTGCSEDEGELNITFTPPAAAPAAFQWRLLTQGTNVLVASGTEADIPYPGITTGEYYLEVRDGACLTTANVSATPPPPIDLTLPFEFSVCDETIARVPYNTSSSQLVSTNPSMQIEGDSVILITEPGSYTVTAFGDGINTCDYQQTLTVSFAQSDPVPFDSRYAICPEDEVEENTRVTIPIPGFVDVEFFDEDDNPLINGNGYNIYSDSIEVFVTGIVKVRMTNAFGCVIEEEFEVVEDCKARINAPNAFSPNGDGLNDFFSIFPVMVSTDDFQIFIFNRWGEMVFESSELNFQWNGGYNNNQSRPLPGGTYAYKISFKSVIESRNEMQEQRGAIILIR